MVLRQWRSGFASVTRGPALLGRGIGAASRVRACRGREKALVRLLGIQNSDVLGGHRSDDAGVIFADLKEGPQKLVLDLLVNVDKASLP